MTVTPFVPTTSAGPATGKAGKADGAGSPPADQAGTPTGEEILDGFLATLSTALAAVAQPTPVGADGRPAPGSSGAADPLSAPAAATPRELRGGGGGSLAAALPGTVAPGPTATTGIPDAGAPATGGTTIAAPVATTQSQAAPGQVVPAPHGGDRPAAPAQAAPLPAPEAGHPGDDAERAVPTTTRPVDGSTLPAGGGGAAQAVSGASDPGARPGGATTTTVLRQVFPEITRVAAQAGPGTHRLSITLHPEALGEVRVTLVVRAGAVHVHLAADGGVARDALLQGAPELHKLLEATGGDARVVVRDSSPTATGADQRGGDGRGQASYAGSAGDGGRDGSGHDGSARDGTPAGAPRDEPTSPRGPRPGPIGGTGTSGTVVHPGRLDRLM